jgi:hypothetical protein
MSNGRVRTPEQVLSDGFHPIAQNSTHRMARLRAARTIMAAMGLGGRPLLRPKGDEAWLRFAGFELPTFSAPFSCPVVSRRSGTTALPDSRCPDWSLTMRRALGQ